MKRFTMLKASLCALCLVVALSCSENKTDSSATPIPQTLSSEKVKVVNGVLVFANQQEFDNTVKALRNKDSKILDEWETQFTEFTSMRKAYNSITEADMIKIGESQSLQGYDNYITIITTNGEKEATRTIGSDAIATLFNKDGIAIIGEDAYKYKFEKIIKVLKATPAEINALASFNPQGLKSKVKEIALIRKVNGQTLSVKNGRPEGIQDDHCLDQYANNRRLVGESNVTWTNNWQTFASVTCVAKHQKRVLGTWWAESIPKIRLTLVSYLTNANSGYYAPPPVPNPKDEDNDGYVRMDMDDCPCNGTIAYTAWGKLSNNDERTCSESETSY